MLLISGVIVEQHDSFYGWGILGLVFFGAIWFCITRPNLKMLEQTPNKLAFRISITFFWGVGVFLAGIGLLSLLFTLTLTPVTTLTCNRTAPSQLSPTTLQDTPASAMCELVGINWFGGEKSKTFISGLQGATAETKIKKDSDGKTTSVYRVVLHTNGGNVPFIEEYTAYDNENRQTLIYQINAYVENSLQASLAVQEDDRLVGYTGFGIGFFFLLLSLLVAAAFPVVTCILDKELNRMTIKRQKWLSEKVFEYPLSDILDVKVEYAGDDSWMYRVTLIMVSGESLPLRYSYTSDFEEKQQIAIYIRRFLSLSSSRLDCQIQR